MRFVILHAGRYSTQSLLSCFPSLFLVSLLLLGRNTYLPSICIYSPEELPAEEGIASDYTYLPFFSLGQEVALFLQCWYFVSMLWVSCLSGCDDLNLEISPMMYLKGGDILMAGKMHIFY